MIQRMRTLLLGSIFLVLAVLVACGGGGDEAAFVQAASAPAAPGLPGFPGSPAFPQFSADTAGQRRLEEAPPMPAAPPPAVSGASAVTLLFRSQIHAALPKYIRAKPCGPP